MAEKLADAVLYLRTDGTAYDAGIRSAEKAAQTLTQRFAAISTKMAAIGKKLTRSLTLPLAAVSGIAVKMAADFEKSMSEIVGLVGVSSDQVDKWSKQILDLAPALGKSPKELAEAMFFITSAGLRGAEALDALVASAKASAGGLGDITAVADAATSAMNAYGAANISAEQATDILVATVREGKVAADELAGSIGKVIPVASAMGVSFDQVGGVIAALTRLGFDAATSTTALRAVMNGLLKPTSEAEDMLAEMGTSAQQLRKRVKDEGLLNVLLWMQDAFKGNVAALAKVFPNVRALSGVLGLLGSNADEAQEIMKSLTEATGSTEKAFEEAEKTITFKFNKALSGVKSSMIKLGEVLAPTIIPMIENLSKAIQKIANWFSNLNPQMQRFVVTMTILAAAIGPAVFIIGKLIAVVIAVQKAFIIAKAALLAFSTAINVSPIGIIVTAVGLLAGGLLLLTQRTKDQVATLKEQEEFQNYVTDGMSVYEQQLLDTTKAVEDLTTAEAERAIQELRNQREVLKARLAALDKYSQEAVKIADDITRINQKIFELQLQWTKAAGKEEDKQRDRRKTGRKEEKKEIIQTEREIEEQEKIIIASRSELALAAAAWRAALAKQTADKEIAEQKRIADETQRIVEQALLTISDFLTRLSGVLSAFAQNRQIELDNEQRREQVALDEEYEQRKENIENTITDEEDKAEALEDLQTWLASEQKTLDDDFEARRRKLARDEAGRAKTLGIFETLVNTAVAITEALKQVWPWNLILAGIVGAMGAAQTAAIAARPLPSLAEGGMLLEDQVIQAHRGETFLHLADLAEELNKSGVTNQMFHVTVQLGSKVLYDDITRASRDGQIIISPRAIGKR